MTTIDYDRSAAIAYAKKWALKRNPKYYDFGSLGGDCTNFVSQCVFAGCSVMNYTPTYGWYYNSLNDRSPAWSGVEFFYDFLINNTGTGPFAVKSNIANVIPGDIIQLGNSTAFYHNLFIVRIINSTIYIAAHTFDAWMRPLDSYHFEKIRFLHLEGARK